MKIKAWKGGRSERIYARMTKEAKAKLLARVKAEGYKSLGDWLKAQVETQLTPRALDKGQICPTCNGLKYIPALKSQPDKQCPQCKGVGQI